MIDQLIILFPMNIAIDWDMSRSRMSLEAAPEKLANASGLAKDIAV